MNAIPLVGRVPAELFPPCFPFISVEVQNAEVFRALTFAVGIG